MLVAGVMLAHQVAAKAVRDAFFLSVMPVTDLPRIVILAALVSVAAVPVYSRLLAWVGPRRLVPAGFLVSALAHLGEWYVSGSGALVAVIVYLHVAAFGALLLSGFWSLTSELFDAHTAKQQFVRIASAGSLGGIAGGLAMERLAAWASLDVSLLLLAALHACCVVVLWPLCQSAQGRSTHTIPEPLFGRQLIRPSRQVLEIAALVVLGTASAAIVDYLLKSRAAAQYSGADLLRFFAIFYTCTQIGAFVFQTTLAAPLQARLGVGRSVSSLPLGVGLTTVGALFFPTTPMFALARGTEFILRGSLFRSGYELLFSPMSPGEKRRVKTFLDVACDRAGDAFGAGIVQVLLLAGPFFLVSELLGVVLLMVAASLWIGDRLDAMYLRTVERRLVDHAAAGGLFSLTELGAPSLPSLEVPRLELPRDFEPISTTHRIDAPVFVPADEPLELLQQLRSGERERVVAALDAAPRFQTLHVAQAMQLLAWDDVTVAARRALERRADHHVGLLTDALLDGATEFAIRRRIPRILISVPAQRTLDGLLLALSDSRFEVRYQCSRAIDRILIAEPALRVDRGRIFQVVERELSVARPVWNGNRLLDQFESSDALMFLDEHLRDRANRSLEHVFSLLVTVLPREPMKVAFRAVHSEDPMLRGLALEYLTGILPEGVRARLWDVMEAGEVAMSPRASHAALEELLRSQDSLLEQLSKATTPSASDAPERFDRPRTAIPPSTRR